MKNYIVYIIIGCIIIVGYFFFFTYSKRRTKSEVPDETLLLTTETEATPVVAGGGIEVDLTLCTPQQDKVYLCPADALSDFEPVVVKNEGQENTCTISYSKDTGFAFQGAVKTGEVPSGDFLASVTDDGVWLILFETALLNHFHSF